MNVIGMCRLQNPIRQPQAKRVKINLCKERFLCFLIFIYSHILFAGIYTQLDQLISGLLLYH